VANNIETQTATINHHIQQHTTEASKSNLQNNAQSINREYIENKNII
jgi:hypothetical protein